jgi:hypothetical protein
MYIKAQYSYFSIVNFRDAMLHTHSRSKLLKRQLHETLIEEKNIRIW